MHGTAGPIDFNVHQPNWKLASRLVRTFCGANDDGHEMCPALQPCPLYAIVPVNIPWDIGARVAERHRRVGGRRSFVMGLLYPSSVRLLCMRANKEAPASGRDAGALPPKRPPARA